MVYAMAGKAKLRERREYWITGGSRAIIEVLEVEDERFADGMRFTYRLLSPEGKTMFAIENEHGTPHMHRGERKTNLECDWEGGLKQFQELVREYEKRKTGNRRDAGDAYGK